MQWAAFKQSPGLIEGSLRQKVSKIYEGFYKLYQLVHQYHLNEVMGVYLQVPPVEGSSRETLEALRSELTNFCKAIEQKAEPEAPSLSKDISPSNPLVGELCDCYSSEDPIFGVLLQKQSLGRFAIKPVTLPSPEEVGAMNQQIRDAASSFEKHKTDLIQRIISEWPQIAKEAGIQKRFQLEARNGGTQLWLVDNDHAENNLNITPQAKAVAWTDIERTPGSCIGPNITDLKIQMLAAGHQQVGIDTLMFGFGDNFHAPHEMLGLATNSWIIQMLLDLPGLIERVRGPVQETHRQMLQSNYANFANGSACVRYWQARVIVPAIEGKDICIAPTGYTFGKPRLVVRVNKETLSIYLNRGDKQVPYYTQTAEGEHWNLLEVDQVLTEMRQLLGGDAQAVTQAVKEVLKPKDQLTPEEAQRVNALRTAEAELILEIPLELDVESQLNQLAAKVKELTFPIFEENPPPVATSGLQAYALQRDNRSREQYLLDAGKVQVFLIDNKTKALVRDVSQYLNMSHPGLSCVCPRPNQTNFQQDGGFNSAQFAQGLPPPTNLYGGNVAYGFQGGGFQFNSPYQQSAPGGSFQLGSQQQGGSLRVTIPMTSQQYGDARLKPGPKVVQQGAAQPFDQQLSQYRLKRNEKAGTVINMTSLTAKAVAPDRLSQEIDGSMRAFIMEFVVNAQKRMLEGLSIADWSNRP